MNPFAYAFASDNTAGATPEALTALCEANSAAHVGSYGADAITQAAEVAIQHWFEAPDAVVFFVFGGTAANALAISALRRPYESVFCTEQAHIEKDESAAPEFFAQGLKLHLCSDVRGDKLDPDKMLQILRGNRGMHSPQAKIISLTQSTEFGTVYDANESAAIATFARENGLSIHMDGARFSNALATSGLSPAQLSWQRGVDVLSFGGTKNGVMSSEAIVFFKPALAEGFFNRRKQGGQLASKMRFLSAPWAGALPHFVSRATHANAAASQLARELTNMDLKLAFPVQANGVFVHLAANVVEYLQSRDWHFYLFLGADIYRFMCAWSTTQDAIEALVADLRKALSR